MYHIFDEKIMITLVTFYAPGCLLALYECEYWRSALISTTTLFFVTLSFRIFCLTVVHPYAKHKSPSNITPPFPESYRTLATYFSRYYRLFFLKGTAAPFNCYVFFKCGLAVCVREVLKDYEVLHQKHENIIL